MQLIHISQFDITVNWEEEAEHDYPVILNVSDTPGPKLGQAGYYWYPINEVSNWGYGPFYWSKKILDKHCFPKQDKILVHCHAGAHRSPMIVFWWLRSHGYSVQTIHDKWFKHSIWRLAEYDMQHGTIPKDLIEFYAQMVKFPEYSLMGILYSMGKYGEH